MYYSTWISLFFIKILKITEPLLLFQIGSDFKNFDENQRNPFTIVHWFLSIWLRFSEFLKLVQNVPQVLPKSCKQFRQNPMLRFRLTVILKISMKINEIHVLQYIGFCQFGCDFPNFRNLSKNVTQVLPKSCEQFRQNPFFCFRLAVIFKILMKNKEIHVLQYMGFCQFCCDFPNFRNLFKTFLRYSRKVVSSFVRTPFFVSDWQ